MRLQILRSHHHDDAAGVARRKSSISYDLHLRHFETDSGDVSIRAKNF
jgi:hypothetical protein